MRDLFLLDPDIVFLNHGSFGACPIPVFEAYQRWQRELERQPVEFLGRRYDALMDSARAALAAYLKTDPANLIFVPNATVGANTVARSLDLSAGDEILSTDHEYGALDLMWEFICRKTGARYLRHPIPLPVTSPQAVVDSLWEAVTPRTRVLFLSHITSPTALILPVAELCRRARQAGIITLVDGAHTPGQIPLDLEAVGADFYTGNCHKWLCAPKGAGFLYARPERHAKIEPLIISWGWLDEGTFASRNQWQGTRDIAAFLSVPDAIAFLQTHDWETVQRRCHTLAVETRQRIAALTGLPPITPDDMNGNYTWFAQMFSAPLPECDPVDVKNRLYDKFRVEVPIITWNDHPLIRVSFQGYNTVGDADRLVDALAQILTGSPATGGGAPPVL